MFRILITDASYKHSVALQRNIRQAHSDVELIGHDTGRCKTAKYYGYLSSIVTGVPLQTAIAQGKFDMIVPVGALSVATVARHSPQLAVLPSNESIDICLDKNATMALADRVGVRRPRSERIRTLDELSDCSIPYPCVIKPNSELDGGMTRYANNEQERKRQVVAALSEIGPESENGILVQEYAKGSGVGFFALYDRGRPVRAFMHQRIREYPVTGGVSTAARAFYHETLKNDGLRLLSALQWNGVAMVEFKYDNDKDQFTLMEINPKFWGSLELALSAGVNFGADLVSLYRGTKLDYSEEYDRQKHFYWPLDGDILNLVRTCQLHKMREYTRPHASTDVGYSRTADAMRLMRTLAKLVTGR